MGKIRSFSGVVVAAAVLCVACGGGADAHKKRVRELEEELTRLQNTHDRLDERVTSLELSRQAPEEASNPAPKSADEPSEQPQTANLERPPLKVFRLAPPGNGAAAAPVAVEEQAEEETGEARPVIRGRGQNIEKAPGTPAQASPKARLPKLSQNESVPKAK